MLSASFSACDYSRNFLEDDVQRVGSLGAPYIGESSELTLILPPSGGAIVPVSGQCTPGAVITFESNGLNPNPQTITCPASGNYSGQLMFGPGINATVPVTVSTPGGVAITENIAINTSTPSSGGSGISGPTSPSSPTNNVSAPLIGSCGLDAANGVVNITTTPVNGFSPNYGVDVGLDANGNYNISDLTWLPGTYTLTVQCTDAAGNGPTVQMPAPSVTVEITPPGPPTITSPVDGSSSNQFMQTVTGMCEAGATVMLTGDLTITPVTGVCATNGTYSIPVTFTSGQGVKNLSAGQTDPAGNASTTTTNVSVIIDTSPPSGTGISGPTSPISPSNNMNAPLIGSCGLGAANGTVNITTVPANGFSPNYGVDVGLDGNGAVSYTHLTLPTNREV